MLIRRVTRRGSITLAVLAMSGTAMADDPATELRTELMHCNPSCYQRPPNELAKKIKTCAGLRIHFTQDRRGRSWGKLERSSAMSPEAVPNCKFPKTVPAKWRAVVAQARKQIDLAKGDFVTVDQDYDDWALEKDDFGRVTARDVIIVHYSHAMEALDRCGMGDPWAVCEGENNELNYFIQAGYRDTEAKKLQHAGDKKGCRLAAWDGIQHVAEARNERAYHVKNGSWQTKTYATRYDGVLTEKAMFAKNDELDTELRTLWTACGGEGNPPMNHSMYGD